MVIRGRGRRGLPVRTYGRGRGALAAYGALAAVDLLGTARAPRGPLRAAKPFLMPALAVYASRYSTSASGRWTPAPTLPDTAQGRARDGDRPLVPAPLAAGLAFATVGDTALLFDDREPAFLLGMAAFLGTQLSYTAGLAQLHGSGIPGSSGSSGSSEEARGSRRRARRAGVGCLAAWAAVNAALAPALERRLRLPVAGYSLALAAMGATALAVGGTVAVGAGAFLASDLLIGAQAAGHEFPSQEVLIMAGYLLGQYLLVTGWLERTAGAGDGNGTA
ncbi:lysoplasmalogenase [Streptomyces sp. N2-109]|uniref:Lysoplasmalogenase n=1 Tax=Streptomyces gossypii TaxID=2883101 RepID=A0ABT2K140_9ACTN|nr:lysoplasmalogenase [Streptomyces gossypii]MCT2592963.1 lysoplasmalogenase [Streptomyces gossypii]MCT2593696.1 lysoplasmalogenase [Streptomyces gossypii]